MMMMMLMMMMLHARGDLGAVRAGIFPPPLVCWFGQRRLPASSFCDVSPSLLDPRSGTLLSSLFTYPHPSMGGGGRDPALGTPGIPSVAAN
jgi:hypothetical protein